MKKIMPLFLLISVARISLAQETLVGSWEGSIQDGARAVRTVLHLALDKEGHLSGTVDSPEQNVFGLALSEVEFKEGAFSFHVPATHANWEGTFNADGNELTGTWKQRGSEIPLNLTRVEVDPIVGTWSGLGDFGAIELRIIFHVGTREDGTFGASMVSPDQSTKHSLVDSVTVEENGQIAFKIDAAQATYEGQLNEDKTSIEGALAQGGGSFPLNLTKAAGAPPVTKRPQTPQPPYPYDEEDVTYPNPEAKNRLAGTLTLPKEGGPFPAVLLITGSGQQDRNEELFQHKPFLVIADALSRQGIAVLRVDDRGVGESTGDVADATSEDFASDVRAGVEFLRTRSDIRSDQIGLMGHSEGGLIAPMVAREMDEVAFIILLAGPGIPGDQILYLQAALLARAGGANEEAIEANRKMQAQIFEILKTETNRSVIRERLDVLFKSVGATSGAEAAQMSSPWFQFFVNYDPAPTLEKITCPVLAINGTLDLQVPYQENLDAISEALEAGGNEDFQVKDYPNLNHLFQKCETGAVSEYGKIEETFSTEVLKDLIDWISKRTLLENMEND